MPSIYDLKSRFQALLRPATNRLAAAGVTANQVTIAALVLSLALGGCIYFWPDRRWPLILVAPLLFVRMALNAIDGMLAREHDQKSHLGCLLNELGDVISDVAIYLPIAILPGIVEELSVAVVLLGVLTEMAGVVALQIGSPRRYEGPLGKSDRAFLFGLVTLLLGIGITPGRWLDILWLIAIVLLLRTVYNRCRTALLVSNPPNNTDMLL